LLSRGARKEVEWVSGLLMLMGEPRVGKRMSSVYKREYDTAWLKIG
jgi:hypothetical protein